VEAHAGPGKAPRRMEGEGRRGLVKRVCSKLSCTTRIYTSLLDNSLGDSNEQDQQHLSHQATEPGLLWGAASCLVINDGLKLRGRKYRYYTWSWVMKRLGFCWRPVAVRSSHPMRRTW